MRLASSVLLAALVSGLLAGCGGGGKGPTSDSTPKITNPPRSASVEVGAVVELSVVATGHSLSYQWSKDGTAISGATTAFYAANIKTATDFGDYTVTVTSGSKSTSATAGVVQIGAPLITVEPLSVENVLGHSVSLTVLATGDDPLVYQWSKDGTPIVGAIAATFTIPSLATTDVGSYSVVVSNAKGRATSAAATVSVVVEEMPRVTLPPASQTVGVGNPATFTVQATGGALTYQWIKDGVPIVGATAATFSIPYATASIDAGSYVVVVTNDKGTATSDAAVLSVLVAPTVTSNPSPLTVDAGAAATFTVVASGSSLKYQWTKDEKAISGATSATYTIPAATASDAGDYAVIVSNAIASVSGGPATLTVHVPPAILSGPTLVVKSGSATVFVTASGASPLVYQWLRNGVPVQGATNASDTIGRITPANSGLYSVVVSNAAGSVTSGTVAVVG